MLSAQPGRSRDQSVAVRSTPWRPLRGRFKVWHPHKKHKADATVALREQPCHVPRQRTAAHGAAVAPGYIPLTCVPPAVVRLSGTWQRNSPVALWYHQPWFMSAAGVYDTAGSSSVVTEDSPV